MTIIRTSKNKELLDQYADQTKDKDTNTEATAYDQKLYQKDASEYTPDYDDHVAYSNVYKIEGLDEDVATNGVSPALADKMFRDQIKKDEEAVKDLLRSAGLDTVPIPVFDALVSFQNQVGDASYIWYEGRKLSMLPWLKKRRWDRIADYLAADERDRDRRAREAAVILYLDYGKNPSESQVVDKGFRKAIGQVKKDPNYPADKKAALMRAYYNHYGYLPKGLDDTQKTQVEDTSSEQQLATRKGPWPY